MFAIAIDSAVRYSDTCAMDWKQLITEITQFGLTQAEIASRTGMAQSAISELATGKTSEPRFSTGRKILALHRAARRAYTVSHSQPQSNGKTLAVGVEV